MCNIRVLPLTRAFRGYYKRRTSWVLRECLAFHFVIHGSKKKQGRHIAMLTSESWNKRVIHIIQYMYSAQF